MDVLRYKSGTVERYDAGTDSYLCIIDGFRCNLKRGVNLEQVVPDATLRNTFDVNGANLEGKKCTVSHYDTVLKVCTVEMAAGETTKLRLRNVVLPHGTCVIIRDDTAKELDGLAGEIISFDPEFQGGDGGYRIRVKKNDAVVSLNVRTDQINI
jgi:hypothetical protein